MQRIATLPDIPADGLRFTYNEGPCEEQGILIRRADGEIRAYKNECRHLPMRLDDREPREFWDPSGTFLVCNSHGARYRPSDGLCVAGPCKGSHLRSLPVVVRDGEVFLDTTKTGSFFDV
ncbi:MAG: Rieske (2Fe-2S) protein [Thermoanaerobaculales bacterium]